MEFISKMSFDISTHENVGVLVTTSLVAAMRLCNMQGQPARVFSLTKKASSSSFSVLTYCLPLSVHLRTLYRIFLSHSRLEKTIYAREVVRNSLAVYFRFVKAVLLLVLLLLRHLSKCLLTNKQYRSSLVR